MRWYLLVLSVLFLSSCRKEISEKEFYTIDSILTVKTKFGQNFFDSLRRIYPTSDYIVAMTAIGLINVDSLDKAEKLLSNRLKKENTFILTAEGILYSKKNMLEKAENFFDRAITSDDQLVNKWLRLYLFYHYRQSNFDKSLEYLDQAIEIDPIFNLAILEKTYLLSPAEQCDSIIGLLRRINQSYKDCMSLTNYRKKSEKKSLTDYAALMLIMNGGNLCMTISLDSQKHSGLR